MSIFKRQEKKNNAERHLPLKVSSADPGRIFDLMELSGTNGAVENPPTKRTIDTAPVVSEKVKDNSHFNGDINFDDLDALNGLGFSTETAPFVTETNVSKSSEDQKFNTLNNSDTSSRESMVTDMEETLDALDIPKAALIEPPVVLTKEASMSSSWETLEDDIVITEETLTEIEETSSEVVLAALDKLEEIESEVPVPQTQASNLENQYTTEENTLEMPPTSTFNTHELLDEIEATLSDESDELSPFQSSEDGFDILEDNFDITLTPSGASESSELLLEDDIEAEDISGPVVQGTDVSAMRYDLTKITTDVENGEALYKRAQARIRNLTGFAEKAEISFSLVARLEPENRRLKTKNLNMSRDLESATYTNSRIESDLKSHKERLTEVSEDLESSNAALSQTLEGLSRVEKELAIVKHDRDIQKLQSERDQTTFNLEVLENKDLRHKLAELTEQVEVLSADKVNVVNELASLKIDLDDQNNARESAESSSLETSMELERTRKQNSKMSVHLNTIKEDIKAFKSQYEYNIVNRDDRIFALESEVEALSKQLSLKDEILANASMDAANLRKTRTAGNSERERLETLIRNQSHQLQLAEEQLLQSRANIQELDKRYKDASSALTDVHTRRLDQIPSEDPDIFPGESNIDIDFDELNKLISE